MIVIAYPTIMDGLVLRWYWDEAAVASHSEFMSVSRNGVEVYCHAANVPAEADATATRALFLFRNYRDDEVKELATHRFTRFMSREIEPIPAAASAEAGGQS